MMTRRFTALCALAGVGALALYLTFSTPSRAQAPDGLPTPTIDITKYGAKADAQIQSSCSVNKAGVGTVNAVYGCTTTMPFTTADIGKTIEIVGAGSSGATLVTTIVALINDDTGAACTMATCAAVQIFATPPASTSGLVVWGTDNGPALTAAGNACPAPSSGSIPLPGPFTSRGCVLLVPSPGSNGTSDYMFATGAVLATQDSFEIRGMGNSGKPEGSINSESGVRFITAAQITILTVGQFSTAANNLGGFQISNITFRDVSGNGSALGGLDMIQMSEAVVAYCDFEGFDGSIPDPANPNATFPLLAYGMKSDPGTQTNGMQEVGFTNNIVLLHDKGQDNAVFYDSSNPDADGPIVLGGDIFPTDNLNHVGVTFSCYGIISGGTIRMYGTHFDVGSDTTLTPNLCTGVKLLTGGIISAKFESTAAHPGNGILLQGGNSAPNSLPMNTGVVRTTGGGANYVTLAFSSPPNPAFMAGQLVSVSCANSSDFSFNGVFVVASVNTGTNTLTYDQVPGAAGETNNSHGGCTATGRAANLAKIDASMIKLNIGLTIQTHANNNQATLLSSQTTTPYSDSGTADIIQLLGTSGSQTIFNYGAATGANVNMFSLADAAMNTGTGSLLNIATSTLSNALPITITAQGNANGVQMSTTGVLAKFGAGSVNADQCNSTTCGTVTSVTGTANQIDIATGTTTPALSLDSSLHIPGTVSQINGIGTVGPNGVAVPLTNTPSGTLRAALAATTLITTPNNGINGDYKLDITIVQVDVGSGCTGSAVVKVNVVYDDPFPGVTQPATLNIPLATGGGTVVPGLTLTNGTPAQVNQGSGSWNITAKPNTAIQYATAYTNCSGSPTSEPGYNITAKLKAAD
ncbi:MAG TPA: hypothetical protein VGW33_07965 [Terriglobia bacterium]|nr:hypothetical protein [Terriglobia bacterium]